MQAESSTATNPIAAWRAFAGGEDEIVAVETLKKRRRTQVYRLVRAEGRGSLIAKHCRTSVAELELLAAREVLEGSSLPFARLLGFGREPARDDGQCFCWVFLEDLGTCRYDIFDATQRSSLARWLGIVGTVTPRLSKETLARLPARLPAHYRSFVDDASSGISRIAGSRPLPGAVVRSMHELVRTLGRAGARWRDLEAVTDAVPTVFVHGDCVRKNIHVVGETVPSVIPLDWGHAGLGLPGFDLGLSTICFARECEVDPDAATYVRAIAPIWPEADVVSVLRLVHLGRLLYVVDMLASSLPVFEHHSTQKIDLLLRLYRQLLERSLESFGRELRGPGCS